MSSLRPHPAVVASKKRIGIVGTGYIAKQITRAIMRSSDLTVSAILTRRSKADLDCFPCAESLTLALEDLLDKSELVVECTGDPLHAAIVVDAAFGKRLPVVTMNSEFHVTCGSYFVEKGYITEAEGDQPGSLASLAEDAVAMGFSPLVYGNMKGFQDLNPSPASMVEWSQRLGFTIEQVTAFTDGTKLQCEQALVANGLNASIARSGLLGIGAEDKRAAQDKLAMHAVKMGVPISDYIIHGNLPPGVFIAASHDDAETGTLKTYKMGDGPWYILERPFHLCGLEAIKTIRRALRGDPPLLNNSPTPKIGVAAVAKRDLPVGHSIKRGLGSLDVRGEAVVAADNQGHVPIGVLQDAVMVRHVMAGCRLSWSDVQLPDSLAVRIAARLFP
jgi:predicted homoserine dehydrogenase-like protein